MLLETGLTGPGHAAEVKSRGDYVTATDRLSEEAILEVLAREAPGIAILAEERGGHRAFGGPREISAEPPISRGKTMWAVDPLDGTTNFVHGFPSVAVSVALLENGRPVYGVILAPFLDLEFTASHGAGAHANGALLSALHAGDPSRAVVATGFPFRNKQLLPRYMSMFRAALERFEDLRRVGAAALDLAWTAAGTFGGFFELNLNTWDVAAGALLVREVGGRVTDWSGGETWLETGNILAGPEAVHEALLELAAQSPDR